MNDKILELKSAGFNHSQIAAMLGVFKQDVDAVIAGATDEVKKTAVVEDKKPKIKKISKDDATTEL